MLFHKHHNRRRHISFEPISACVEFLEDRLLLFTLSGTEWPDTTISFSFLPDGTQPAFGSGSSTLFAKLDPIAPTDVWQRELARALQTWQNETNIDFYMVTDDGSPSGIIGSVQGDSRFGDIRLGAASMDFAGFTFFPHSSNTLGGDVTISSNINWVIGSFPDLYSILLHETGHSLGLRHSEFSGTVMFSTISGQEQDLTTDDIAGIHAIYGVRQADVFDQASSNDTFITATSISGIDSFIADLTSIDDADYYEFTTPIDFDGTMIVSVDVNQISLLAPQISLFDSSENLIATANNSFGQTATLNLTGLIPNTSYVIMADGATIDEFGMGAYVLKFGDDLPEPPVPPPEPEPQPDVADRFEVNDSFETATDLGKINRVTEESLTFHTNTDIDFFTFNVRKNGKFDISVSLANIILHDADHNIIAEDISQISTVQLTSGEQYHIQIIESTGAISFYDLVISKTKSKGNGKGRGNQGGNGDLSIPSTQFATYYFQNDLIHHNNDQTSIQITNSVHTTSYNLFVKTDDSFEENDSFEETDKLFSKFEKLLSEDQFGPLTFLSSEKIASKSIPIDSSFKI